jgi:uncharacterized protein YkwD
MRKFRFLFCQSVREIRVLSCAAFFLICSAATFAQSPPLEQNDSERQFFEALNRERTAAGVAPLKWDNALFAAARRHALLMLNLNSMEHQLPGEANLAARLGESGARFSAVAENIAIGSSPQLIHGGWMDSPGHRANILNSRFTSVGIAAVRGNGGLYSVEDFSHEIPELSLEQQEEKIIALLGVSKFQAKDATGDARKTCQMRKTIASPNAKSMIWFETPDLDKLPEEVDRKIRERQFNKAAVGACASENAVGFTQYRFAILFF